MLKLILFLMLPLSVFSQDIPANARTIMIKDISFAQVCEALLDKGYQLEGKDNELQTVRTGAIVYPRYWNGAYKINVRVKDSTAHFTGIYQIPYETQFTSILIGQTIPQGTWDNDHYIYYQTNKKGKPLVKSATCYPFLLMNDFVKSLGKEVSYK